MSRLAKFNWKKAAKIGGCLFAGVLAFLEALGDEKQAEKMLELEARVAELESK